ncbi:hypothetical protein K6959_04565 [Bacillus aquiflavi]|uniref:hypothetical protein n=1 Tax=Bacillus aquiflavi TaxID=2672567 RepID=UPI001CAA1871|nr:hypothetical protein [Bacillus aquiflavi]UAC49166.1 hypothetical protein K6959_04565 [Bacillus aquiflavi]
MIVVILVVGALFHFSFLPYVGNRIIEKYGVRAIAYIRSSKINKGIFFEHAGIWSNRVDVQLEITGPDGKKFSAKARDFIVYWEAEAFHSHKKMVVRYFPIYKKRVRFDPMHHREKRERVVQSFEKRQTNISL